MPSVFIPPEIALDPAYAAAFTHHSANPDILEVYEWKRLKNKTMILQEKPTDRTPGAPQPPIAYIVSLGTVVPSSLSCTPLASNNRKFNNDPIHSKYRVLIGKPDHPVWCLVWDAAQANITSVVSRMAKTTIHLWDSEGNLRLSEPLFTERSEKSPLAVDDPNAWPVPKDFQSKFANLLSTHDLCRMVVFDVNNNLVAPADVPDHLVPGSLVEATYKLVYTPITEKVDGVSVTKHSVNAVMIQVCVVNATVPRLEPRFSLSTPYRPGPAQRDAPFPPPRTPEYRQTLVNAIPAPASRAPQGAPSPARYGPSGVNSLTPPSTTLSSAPPTPRPSPVRVPPRGAMMPPAARPFVPYGSATPNQGGSVPGGGGFGRGGLGPPYFGGMAGQPPDTRTSGARSPAQPATWQPMQAPQQYASPAQPPLMVGARSAYPGPPTWNGVPQNGAYPPALQWNAMEQQVPYFPEMDHGAPPAPPGFMYPTHSGTGIPYGEQRVPPNPVDPRRTGGQIVSRSIQDETAQHAHSPNLRAFPQPQFTRDVHPLEGGPPRDNGVHDGHSLKSPFASPIHKSHTPGQMVHKSGGLTAPATPTPGHLRTGNSPRAQTPRPGTPAEARVALSDQRVRSTYPSGVPYGFRGQLDTRQYRGYDDISELSPFATRNPVPPRQVDPTPGVSMGASTMTMVPVSRGAESVVTTPRAESGLANEAQTPSRTSGPVDLHDQRDQPVSGYTPHPQYYAAQDDELRHRRVPTPSAEYKSLEEIASSPAFTAAQDDGAHATPPGANLFSGDYEQQFYLHSSDASSVPMLSDANAPTPYDNTDSTTEGDERAVLGGDHTLETMWNMGHIEIADDASPPELENADATGTWVHPMDAWGYSSSSEGSGTDETPLSLYMQRRAEVGLGKRKAPFEDDENVRRKSRRLFIPDSSDEGSTGEGSSTGTRL